MSHNPCLTCELPDCDETDPGCRLRLVKHSPVWARELRQIGNLAQGEQITLGPLTPRQVRSLRGAIYRAQVRGELPEVSCRLQPIEDGRRLMDIRGGKSAERWTRWAEQRAIVAALEVGQEATLHVSADQIDRLQKTLLKMKLPGRRVTTWRIWEDDRPRLHVRLENGGKPCSKQ